MALADAIDDLTIPPAIAMIVMLLVGARPAREWWPCGAPAQSRAQRSPDSGLCPGGLHPSARARRPCGPVRRSDLDRLVATRASRQPEPRLPSRRSEPLPQRPKSKPARTTWSSRSRRRRVGCGSLWPPGSGAARIAPRRRSERRAPPDDEVLVKTWVEPGGAGQTIRPIGAPCARSRYADQIQIKAPRRFHIGVFPLHSSGGAGNSTDAEARRMQHPELFTCAKPSATRSQHNG